MTIEIRDRQASPGGLEKGGGDASYIHTQGKADTERDQNDQSPFEHEQQEWRGDSSVVYKVDIKPTRELMDFHNDLMSSKQSKQIMSSLNESKYERDQEILQDPQLATFDEESTYRLVTTSKSRQRLKANWLTFDDGPSEQFIPK